jgi:hypothetical protein
MTFAIFTRSDMVINPGWGQVLDATLVLISTCGITFAMFGRYAPSPGLDIALRLGLAVISFVTMFHPNRTVSVAVAALVLPAIIMGIMRHRVVAPPAQGPVDTKEEGDEAELQALLAEAKREV